MKTNETNKIKTGLKITTLEELTGYSDGSIVQFPSFDSDHPFVARVCRPSLLALARDGKIPNELLNTVNEMFTSSSDVYDTDNKEMLKDMAEVIDILADNMFLEPTYQEIQSAGIELTDDQKIFLYNYSQTGVKSLKLFRAE